MNTRRNNRMMQAAHQDAQPWPEHTPTHTLDRQVKQAREDIGDARWSELSAEWE